MYRGGNMFEELKTVMEEMAAQNMPVESKESAPEMIKALASGKLIGLSNQSFASFFVSWLKVNDTLSHSEKRERAEAFKAALTQGCHAKFGENHFLVTTYLAQTMQRIEEFLSE
jgi:hypothetical protein